MKVLAFSGAQNTGKTTLMNEYAKHLRTKEFKVYTGYKLPEDSPDASVSRRSKRLGFGINENSSFESQYHIMLSYLLADMETRKLAEQGKFDWLLYDRSVMDHLPYSHRVANGEGYFMLESISNQHRLRFPVDYTVYCHPVPFAEDGHRSVNQVFQDEIVELFDQVMPAPDLKLPNIPVEHRIGLLDRYLEL